MDSRELENRIHQLMPDGKSGKRNLLPLYADGAALQALVAFLAEPFRGQVDYVCSPESLGFIIGSMLARELGVGFVAIRRNRQFPARPEEQLMASFIDHRDQVTFLSTGRALLPKGSRVLLADDWIETAATSQACMNMIEDAGCKLAGIAAVGADYRSAARDMIDAGQVHCAFLER